MNKLKPVVGDKRIAALPVGKLYFSFGGCFVGLYKDPFTLLEKCVFLTGFIELKVSQSILSVQ